MKKINPAVKNMAQLALYIVVLIGLWSVISLVAFPKQTTLERLTAYVKHNEAVLVQVAENAMDENTNPGIMNAVEVMKLLGAENITSVEPYRHGAAFHIVGDDTPKNGALDILYLPDGAYSLDREGEWSSAAPDKNGTLRFESGENYVAVTRLTDCFFLEESA